MTGIAARSRLRPEGGLIEKRLTAVGRRTTACLLTTAAGSQGENQKDSKNEEKWALLHRWVPVLEKEYREEKGAKPGLRPRADVYHTLKPGDVSCAWPINCTNMGP